MWVGFGMGWFSMFNVEYLGMCGIGLVWYGLGVVWIGFGMGMVCVGYGMVWYSFVCSMKNVWEFFRMGLGWV